MSLTPYFSSSSKVWESRDWIFGLEEIGYVGWEIVADGKYRLLRRVLRSAPARWLGRRLPPALVWRIAGGMTHHFTGEEIARRMPLGEIFDDFAARKLAEGFDTVILGHLHRPAFQTHPNGLYINLGDWVSARTWLDWDDGRLTLQRHTASETP